MEQHSSGLMVRPGTMDDYVIREQEGSYGHVDVAGKTVLDLGGNIGASAKFFLDRGAAKVITYEPLTANFKVLMENVGRDPRVLPIQAAVGAENTEMPIFVAPNRKNMGNTSLHVQRGRILEEVVPVFSMDTVLKEHQPDVIKCDIEGGEYDIFPRVLPDHVRAVTMELHFGKAAWRRYGAPRICSSFDRWNCVHAKGSLDKGNWTMLRSWTR